MLCVRSRGEVCRSLLEQVLAAHVFWCLRIASPVFRRGRCSPIVPATPVPLEATLKTLFVVLSTTVSPAVGIAIGMTNSTSTHPPSLPPSAFILFYYPSLLVPDDRDGLRAGVPLHLDNLGLQPGSGFHEGGVPVLAGDDEYGWLWHARLFLRRLLGYAADAERTGVHWTLDRRVPHRDLVRQAKQAADESLHGGFLQARRDQTSARGVVFHVSFILFIRFLCLRGE